MGSLAVRWLPLFLSLSMTFGGWSVAAGADTWVADTVVVGSAEARHLDDAGHVALFELTGDYDRFLADGSLNADPRAALAREFFATHPDRYDFLITFTTFDIDTAGPAAFHISVRNGVEGTGQALFDNSDFFGSGGVLQGYIDMARLAGWETDPTAPGFERTLSALVHEIFHQWTAYVRFQDGGGDSDALLTTEGIHWSFHLDTGGSVMGGNDWRDNGDGTFTALGPGRILSPLDLYLGGFYRPEEVPPFFLLESTEGNRDDPAVPGTRITATRRDLTVDDVIAVHGPRLPAAGAAGDGEGTQRAFRAAFLLVTRPGESVTAAQLEGLERLRRGLLERFPILTGGRGVLEIYPQAPLDPPGTPQPLPGGDPRTGPASLAEGVAWLRGAQRGEGFWEDRASTRLRDTALALETLTALDPIFTGGAAALTWLEGQSAENTDSLARWALTLHGAGRDTVAAMAALVARQNADGGWGLGPGLASNSLDTALAVSALAQVGGDAGAIDRGGAFLRLHQTPEGGWSPHPEGSPRTVATTAAVAALVAAGQGADALPSAVAFLAGRQNPDGGFGDSPSTSSDTASVLNGLIPLGLAGEIDGPAAVTFLEGRQSTDGSWEGSTSTTARVLTALKGFGFPNWAFTGPVTAAPAGPVDGVAVRLAATVANLGNGAAPAGGVRFFDGDPGGAGTPIGDASIPPLAPGESAPVSVLWDTFDLAGPHTVVVVVDPAGTVEELSEADNRAELDLTVAPAPDGAELSVTAEEVLVLPPRPDSLPAPLTVTAAVRNLGQTDALATRVVLWLGEVGVGAPVAEQTVDLLQRRATAVNFGLTLTQPGPALLTVEVDPDDAVVEADEGNNRASVTVTPVAAVDLEVTAADLELVGTPTLGADVTFRARFRNRGTAEVSAAEVRFLVDGEALRSETLPLAAGEVVEREILWRVDRTGPLDFVVQLDPTGVVVESDESNNGAVLPFVAGVLGGDNLTVSATDLTAVPEPLLQGAPATVSILLRNTGGGDLADVEVAFYGGEPAAGGALLATAVVPMLAAGEAATVTASPPALTPVAFAEALPLFVVADPAGAIAEVEEGDNVAFRTVEVLSLPDLVPGAGSVVVEPAFPRVGDPVMLSVTVANLGDQPAAATAVRLEDGGGVALGTDQPLQALAPAETAVVRFTFPLPPADPPDPEGAVTLRLVVDPAGLVPEADEGNNSAVYGVTPRDPDAAVVPAIFSPNGDGVLDTATLFFTLPEGTATAVVEVTTAEGEVVRRVEGLSGNGGTEASFVWDGRDAAGRVVTDGDYRLAALRPQGGVLAEGSTVVDTDRSSLFEALGTPFARFTDLTCELTAAYQLQFPLTEAEAYFANGAGVFRVPARGGPREKLADGNVLHLRVSDSGRHLAFSGFDGPGFVRTARGDGSGVTDLNGVVGNEPSNAKSRLAFLPGTEDLLYYDPVRDQIFRRPLDDPGAEGAVLASTATPRFGQQDAAEDDVSPDGDRLLFGVFGGPGLEIGTLAGDRRTVQDSLGRFDRRAWSPDGTRVAVVAGDDELLVADREGALLHRIPLPMETMAQIPAYDAFGVGPAFFLDIDFVTTPSWSTGGEEFVVVVRYEEFGDNHDAFFARVLVVNAVTGSVRTAMVTEPLLTLFSFHISTWDGSAWVERGELHHGMRYGERQLDLSTYLPDPDGEYKVRIRQQGLEAAHLDRVALRLGGGDDRFLVRPAAARWVDGGSGPPDGPSDGPSEGPLEIVRRADREVLDVHERELEVEWRAPAGTGGALEAPFLALLAREESLSGRDARPFRYPFRGVPLTGEGPLSPAGEGEPLFTELSIPGTGHPAGMVYGYAADDGETLFATLDFTVDNTEDDVADWADLLVRVAGEEHRFRITATEGEWGQVHFRHTDKAHHRHKVYTFAVPFAELGLEAGASGTVQVAFEAYGTAAVLEEALPPTFSEVRWVPGEDRLLVWEDFSGSAWTVALPERTPEGAPERVFATFDAFEGAYFSRSGRKLLFRDDLHILDPQHPCYNPAGEAGTFSFDTLANLTAELMVVPAADGRGVRLEGTATDLHFASWRLEFARDALPDFWLPIGTVSPQPVVEDLFTLWLPPDDGGFRVRLTVRDRAGNEKRVVRRLAATGSGASLADLSLAPRLFSPNGDGVLEAVVLSYRTVEPVNLEITVRNIQGDPVRRLDRAHPAPGSFTVSWDGRDDAGLPVPDGAYRVEVQSFAFPVTIDTRPPEAEVELRGPRGGNAERIEVAPAVTWCGTDAHLESLTLSRGRGAAPLTWERVATLPLREGCDPALNRRALTLEAFTGWRYRLEAQDQAGNRTVVISDLAAEALLLTGLGPAAAGAPDPLREGETVPLELGLLRLALAESAVGPLTQLTLEARDRDTGAWLPFPLTDFLHPDGSAAVGVPDGEAGALWPLSTVSVAAVRLVGRTGAGTLLTSNAVPVGVSGVNFEGRLEADALPGGPLGSALAAALEASGLDPRTDTVLWGWGAVTDPLVALSLVVASGEDPAFAGGVPLPPAAEAAFAGGTVWVFDGLGLRSCLAYTGRLVAQVVGADDPTGTTVALESLPQGFQLPCLSLQIEPRPAVACGAERAEWAFTPVSHDGVELRLLTVALTTADNVVFNANAPVSEETVIFDFEGLALAEGRYPLIARLSNGDGVVVERRAELVVDRTPAAVAVTSPFPGAAVCAGAGGVPVAAEVDDVGGGFALFFSVNPTPEDLDAWGAPQPAAAPGVAPAVPVTDAVLPLEALAFLGEVATLGTLGSESAVDGEVAVRLEVVERGGARRCAEVVFSADGAVAPFSLVVENALFSPDGDGILEAATVQLAPTEGVTATVEIFTGQLQAGGEVLPTGAVLRTLVLGAPVVGSAAWPWDGRRGDGTLLADGLYVAVVTLVDGCGNTVQDRLTLEIDTQAPQVAWDAPAPGASVPLMVELVGTVTDPHLLDWEVEFGAGANPTSWALLASSNVARVTAPLALWNTFGLNGEQTVRLSARDRAGHAAAATRTFTVAPAGDLLEALEAVPALFSPNGDSRRDTTAARFTLSRRAEVTLEIVDAGGAVVATLLPGVEREAGPSVERWDGGGVADGAYRLRLTARDPVSAAVQTEAVPVEIDTVAPVLAVTRPADGGGGAFVAGVGSVLGSVTDPRLESWKVSLTDTPAAPVWGEIGGGTTPVMDGPLASLEGLAEGAYAVRVEARDGAENRAETILPFTVDNTPPEATLTTPAAGAVLGAATVTVEGTVEEAHLRSWRLEFAAGDPPAELAVWQPIAAGAAAGAVTAAWDLTVVADGLYTLRLVAEDAAGLTAEVRRPLRVDRTPPVVAITVPGEGAFVTAPSDIRGTASDADLRQYRLELAPQGSALFIELGRRTLPVVDGVLLPWRTLPPDGVYTLRLTADDGAGNRATTAVTVTVDTTPPGSPRALSVEAEGDGARLQWQAPASAADVDLYRVYRDGVLRLELPAATLTTFDPGLTEGSYPYTVTAVDRAGLESAAAGPTILVIDRTPPRAVIHAPLAEAAVSGVVEVTVTAFAQDDFAAYRLWVAPEGTPAGAGTLLRTSPVPVRSTAVASWDTGLAGDGRHTLTLEGEDLRGNIATVAVTVAVDNAPPAAPTGLVATATVVGGAADVELTWNASPAPDLAGYRLFRDGVEVAAGIAGPPFTEVDVPDGTLTYTVVAEDGAGNLSAPSAPASVTVERRAPAAVLVIPGDGTVHDPRVGALYLLATTIDRDVAQVDFQFRPVGSGPWSPLPANGTDLAPPWEAEWDASALPFGDYQLRAVATDTGNRTDAAPALITLTLQDLERPAAVTGVVAQVDGDTVTVSWTPGTEPDLAGYHVERSDALDPDAPPVRLTAVPLAPPFSDLGVPEGEYLYTVIATDAVGNEADPSPVPASARIYTPGLEPPASPTSELTIAFTGQAGTPAAGGVAAVEVTDGGGAPLPGMPAPVLVAADGSFAFPAVPVAAGENTVTVTVTDGGAAVNRSKPATFPLLVSQAPAAPTGLAGSAAGLNVNLTWDANGEADLLGYRVFRDGEPLVADPLVSVLDLNAFASSQWSSTYRPTRALDGNLFTYWAPNAGASVPVAGQWWAAFFARPIPLTEIRLSWFSVTYRAVDFDVEVIHLGQWVRLLAVRNNEAATQRFILPGHFTTQGVRILIHRANLADTAFRPLRLSEVELVERGVIATPAFTDSNVPEGFHDYTVTALGPFFESPPSAVARVGVGDVVPPSPVVLSATAVGSEVQLSWTASPDGDLARYDLYRGGIKVAEIPAPTTVTVDGPLPNGSYGYTVRAVDGVGNASVPSNEVTVNLTVLPPGPPTALTVVAVPAGTALDLRWQPPAGGAAAYRVLRSLTAGGPFTPVAEVAAASYRDEGLTNGTLYVYTVQALDAAGNASAPSNEASGTPQDTEGPASPILTFPGPSPVAASSPLLRRLTGSAEAGVAVTLFRDGVAVGTTTSSTAVTVTAANLTTFDMLRPSPDGTRLWVDDYSDHLLYDFTTATLLPLPPLDGPVRWFPDGQRVAVAHFDFAANLSRLWILRPEDGSIEEVATVEYAEVALPSPDGTQLLVWVFEGFSDDLYLYDLATGDRQALGANTSRLDPESLTWSPDGTRIAYQRRGSIDVVDLPTGTVREIETDAGFAAALSFTPDGGALVYSGLGPNFWEQVVRYDLTTDTREVLTAGDADHSAARLAPDGRRVAYVLDFQELWLLDPATGETTLLRTLDFWGDTLHWVPGGSLFLADDGVPLRLTPAGSFTFTNLPLHDGDNVFTATAADAAGNASASSAPLVVTLSATALPDLVLTDGDVEALPPVAVVGEPVRLSATVFNLGGVAAPAATVTLVLVAEDGTTVALFEGLPLPALAPAEGATVQGEHTFSDPGEAGAYAVVAVVDPDNAVLEASETNNRGERPLAVLTAAEPELALTLDRGSYATGDTVLLRLTLRNGGAPVAGTVELRIEDGAGFLVEALTPLPVPTLATGESWTAGASWVSGNTLAGSYRVRATFMGDDGSTAEAQDPFTLTAEAQVRAAVASDRPAYPVGSPVRFTGTAEVAGEGALVTGATARLTLADSAGTVFREWLQPLGDLLSGATVTVPAEWASGARPAGRYRLGFQVLLDGGPLATAESFFDLTAAAPQLVGGLTLDPPAPAVGERLGVTYTVEHQDLGTSLVDLPLRILLLNAAGTVELGRFETLVTLAPGETVSGTATFETASLGLATYLVRLEVQPPVSLSRTPALPVTKMASFLTLQGASFTTLDRTPPTLRLLAPVDGGFLGTDLRARLEARDTLSAVAAVEVQVDGGPWQGTTLADSASGLWRRLLSLPEGAHTVAARGEDVWGNRVELPPVPFTVDLTAPEITITGVAPDTTYLDPRTPVIAIVEAHPEVEVLTLNGAPFTSGTLVTEPGSYFLQVFARDRAGNVTTRALSFAIAVPAPPVLSVDGAVTGLSALEGNAGDGDLLFTLRLSAPVPAGGSASVDFVTVPGSAAAEVDYRSTGGTVTFAPGETVATVPVAILGDTLPELDEDFRILLSNPQGLILESPEARATIVDDDLLGLVLSGGAAEEGASLAFTVRLSTLSARPVTVGYTTVEGAGTAGATTQDFAAASGTLDFPPGVVERVVTVALLEDNAVEGDETFLLRLVTATGADLSTDPAANEAVGTVLDNDLGVVPQLVATKVGTPVTDLDGDGQLGSGDTVEYVITVVHGGGPDATLVTFFDAIPDHTTVVPGSVLAVGGTILGENPVEVDFGTLTAGQQRQIQFRVTVDTMLEESVREILNQGQFTTAEVPVVVTDDPGSPGAADPTVLPVGGATVLEIPTLDSRSLALLVLLLLAAGWWTLRGGVR